ncbi:5-hydroxyisourate hydrolase [Paenibacillus sp. CCS19]|uniref:hydroxyisourate hydrolase n=1 Tax=Paenibacillus sp. CCS19 TaxID=3158387 RepID=UPI0025688794|nr:hydroxyisourate hydrolase [Paenibacillus cellulosilyticus]GMK38842.1 5-hydroxyisourate hydrolase [Paenibacillus cellulosilyticus]
MSGGRLTTHVLDVSRGRPAPGVKVQLWRLDGTPPGAFVTEAVTNADGRLNQPLLAEGCLECGVYELLFHIGGYFGGIMDAEGEACSGEEIAGVSAGAKAAAPAQLLEQVPVRFRVTDPEAHYHIPLLAAPGGYSTYRGS